MGTSIHLKKGKETGKSGKIFQKQDNFNKNSLREWVEELTEVADDGRRGESFGFPPL